MRFYFDLRKRRCDLEVINFIDSPVFSEYSSAMTTLISSAHRYLVYHHLSNEGLSALEFPYSHSSVIWLHCESTCGFQPSGRNQCIKTLPRNRILRVKKKRILTQFRTSDSILFIYSVFALLTQSGLFHTSLSLLSIFYWCLCNWVNFDGDSADHTLGSDSAWMSLKAILLCHSERNVIANSRCNQWGPPRPQHLHLLKTDQC